MFNNKPRDNGRWCLVDFTSEENTVSEISLEDSLLGTSSPLQNKK